MENKNNMTIFDMLSKAFYLCKDNILEILKVIGIYIIPSIVILIVTFISLFSGIFVSMIFATMASYEKIISSTIGLVSILLMLIIICFIALMSGFGGLVIARILDEGNKGNKITWKEATKYVWSKKWSALGLNILLFLMLFSFFVVVIFLTALISIITFGIGAIIMIPLALALFFIVTPFSILCNSIFIVRDLTATQSIGEAFLLFKTGGFWKSVGVLASIGGVSALSAIILYVLQLIPILGFFIGIVGQSLINAYAFAYLNIFSFNNNTDKISNLNL